MHKEKNYIIVKDRHPRISEVLNDCVNLCVPASRNESLASILQKICSRISSNYTELQQLIEEVEASIPSYFLEAGENIVVSGTGSESDPWVISTPVYSLISSPSVTISGTGTEADPWVPTVSIPVQNALNGLSLTTGNAVLGQDVGAAGNPATLISNREVPMNNFSVKFSNGVSTEGVTIRPTISVNSGTDNHFSGSNVVGNLVASITAITNISTSSSVAAGGTGKSAAIYADTRFTYLDNIALTLRSPSLFGTAIDNVNANTTYNNWNGSTGFTHSYSRMSIGGPRRQTGYSGAITINYPSTLEYAMAVDRIQFNAETNHAKTFTGHMAGLVLETKVDGTGTFNWYTDLLLGRRHGENAGMTFATRHGIYVLPIKAANVTNAYSIYQQGTTDQNFFAANVGIGLTANTFNTTSAKLQVDSTTQGFLPPRMTTTERDAIASPAAGLIIYNTTTNKLNMRAAAAWEAITSA